LVISNRQKLITYYQLLITEEKIMPNPKRRHSHSRTRQRRAHDALKVPQFYLDKDTGEPKVPHRVDPKTGVYKGRQILDVKETE
jgi:large subunit ribosomal protein L32